MCGISQNLILTMNWFLLKISDLRGAWNRITAGELTQAWDRLSPGDQFFLPVFGINVIVFGLWRIPRLQTMLLKNFCANPSGRKLNHELNDRLN